MKAYREELARRLCERNHNARFRGLTVPCATHLHEANSLWYLMNDEGAKSLEVLFGYKAELALADPDSVKTRDTLGTSGVNIG